MKYPIKIKVIISEEVQTFVASLPEKVQDKIFENIRRVAGGERNVEIFKKLENSEIWEFRTRFLKMAYRILAFWDESQETLVVTTHGFIKKTQKTPPKEIEKAERIRKEYISNKRKD
ncbi:MAG: type II toxin-antitoxin system RelE/ParE family toxin [Bacteroidales bacterium]|nr:type II toxin-antitoxin system RelE/ParE family toxin [Bacteroidales bacterium]